VTESSRSANRRGWFDLLIDALAAVAAVLLCALTLLICVDAVGRIPSKVPATAHLSYTISWTLEVAQYTLYIITFFGAPWVLRDGGHIAIDLFVHQLKPEARRTVTLATNVICAVVCLVLFYFACRVWWTSFHEHVMVVETFRFPEWWLLSPAPPTFLILFFIFVRWIVHPQRQVSAAPLGHGS
jgi:TRAP-type C4-dicarboxylate transport system permease small subunit